MIVRQRRPGQAEKAGSVVPFFIFFFMLFILTGLLFFGPTMWLLWRSGFSAYPPTRAWPLFKWGIGLSLPVYAAVLLTKRLRAWLKSFRRRRGRFWPDYGRSILQFLLIVSLVFLPLVLANGIAFLNGVLDGSPERIHRTVVSGKNQSGGGRSAVSRILKYSSWEGGGGAGRLEVQKEIFDNAQIGSSLEIMVKPGFFGFEWVVSYRLRGESRHP